MLANLKSYNCFRRHKKPDYRISLNLAPMRANAEIINFGISEKSINTIVSNGKRFIAYKIVERLKEQIKLSEAVSISDKKKGKIHQVFERSFDCKEITSQHFFLQKLSYMHSNPCTGVWHLVKNPVDYQHSSAKFYISGEQGKYFY